MDKKRITSDLNDAIYELKLKLSGNKQVFMTKKEVDDLRIARQELHGLIMLISEKHLNKE